MTKAVKVARYFLSLADEEAGDVISNLKLQKLLYYAQGFHLALFKKPLFDDEIRAWTHGPVVPSTYHVYKDFGAAAIPIPDDIDPNEITDEERGLLDEVYNVYGQYSAWKLRNMTHTERPWVDAYNLGPDTVISDESMTEFFRHLTN